MHVVVDHARISRGVVKNSLEERHPGLINLPIPLPSIPILNPVVTALVGGNNQPSPTPPPPPSAPTPTPPPSSPPPSGGGGSGDGNGNGNEGGNGGGDGNNNGGSTGNGDGNSGGDGGSSGGSNGGNDPGSGSTGGSDSNSGGGTTGSGSGGNGDSTNTGSSSPEQSGAPGNPGNSNGSSSGSSGSSNTSSSSDGGESSGDTSGSQNGDGGNNGGGGAVGNAGTNPNETGSGHGLKSGIATGTGPGSPNATGAFSPGVDGSGGNGGSGPGGSTSNGNGGISKGAVAAIAVVGVLVFLAALVFVLRRRAVARRSDRRNRWWGKKDTAAPGPQYGDRTSIDSTNSRTASVRSSFATTFDHGQTPRLTMDFSTMPPLPPMAEIRNGPVAEGQLFSPANDTPILVSFDNSHVTPTGEARYSTHSVSSNTSDGYSQYLVVANSGLIDSPEIRTPMSVRPFSPSESFAFPKPPNVQSGDWSNAGSRPQSSSTLATLKSPELTYLGSPVPPTPALPKDPFADPSKPEFVGFETICRPFVPTLGDEMAVAIGDSVKVLNIFDDGWAMVEKVTEGTEVVKPQSGLIPIDCLRAINQDLPAFMSERRVSIPYADSADGHGVVAL